MFLRFVAAAVRFRRRRLLLAFSALAVAATLATALFSVYSDIDRKMRVEFRGYGANIIVAGREGASLPSDALTQVDSILAGRGIAAPFGLIVARTGDGQPGPRWRRRVRAPSAQFPRPAPPPDAGHISLAQQRLAAA